MSIFNLWRLTVEVGGRLPVRSRGPEDLLRLVVYRPGRSASRPTVGEAVGK